MHKLFSIESTRLNPYFGWFVLLIFMPAKAGIESCRFAGECACTDVTIATLLELCLHEDTNVTL